MIDRIRNYINSSIRNRIVISFGGIVFFIVIVIEIFCISLIENYYVGGAEQILKERVNISSDFVNNYVPYSSVEEKAKFLFDNLVTESDSKFLIQVLDKEGNVLMDSYGLSDFQNIDTPDVKAAMNKNSYVYIGELEPTGERIMAFSKPLTKYSAVDGVLRYSISLEKIYDVVTQYNLYVILVGIVLVLIFIVISMFISKTIVTPIIRLTATATEMAEGDFYVRAERKHPDEIGQLADKINYMAEEIIKTDNIKKDFISSISHELRTPLTSIKGWGETLLLNGVKEGSIEEMGINIINTEAERLKDIVEELLDFSRLESRTMKANKAKIYPRRILKSVYNQFLPRGKEHNISFTLDGEETAIYGDANKIRQVFINVLANAIKFTPKGGEINLYAIGKEDSVEIIVEDTGIGISEDDLTRVREKFYKANVSSAGSGLGLSIVDEILKLHEATMNIESVLGEGTKVTIIFPAMLEEE